VVAGILASDALIGGIVGGVVVLAVVALIVARSIMTVVTEYQRAVFFRFGRIRSEAKGPGLIMRIPGVDRVVKVNLRVEVVDIPPQSAITADNVTLQVDAVVYFRVADPVRAVVGVDNFRLASQRIAMTSLRSIIGRHELDNLLAHRDDINNELKAQIALSTQGFGVEVHEVQIRDISLPTELVRAMSRQAEAERERRAKVIAATGELEASRELSEAATMLASAPGSMQLRSLQTLAEVATEHNSTLVFPIPIELLEFLRRPGTPDANVPFAVPPPGAASAAPPAGPAPVAPVSGAAAELGAPTAHAADGDGPADGGGPPA
jgi:regulator of protease activity HflC (stomatin/prohibitin superfamily)